MIEQEDGQFGRRRLPAPSTSCLTRTATPSLPGLNAWERAGVVITEVNRPGCRGLVLKPLTSGNSTSVFGSVPPTQPEPHHRTLISSSTKSRQDRRVHRGSTWSAQLT